MAWWADFELEAETDLEAWLRTAASTWMSQWWKATPSISANSLAEKRYAFAAGRAYALARYVDADVGLMEPGVRLSTRMVFLVSANRLVVVVGPQEPGEQVDTALAFGLAFAGDRDLVVVLPIGETGPTLDRAAFIDTHVEVWGHDGGLPVHLVTPPRRVVIDGYQDPLVTTPHALSIEQGQWVAPLRQWADSHPALVPAHRSRYLAWHSGGRLVLKIASGTSGVSAGAGVHYSRPDDSRPAAVLEVMNGPLSDEALERLRAAVDDAIAGRATGADAGHREHRMQEALGQHPHELGLTDIWREFPASRPRRRRAYIDLLGTDERARIHIIETKLGNDEMFVLQGLDYWIWAQAHRLELAELFDLKKMPEIVIDFVTGENGDGLGPYSAAQAESLSGEITWRFASVTGWESGKPHVEMSANRRSPDGVDRVVKTQRYAIRLQRALTDPAMTSGRTFFRDPREGVDRAALPAYEDLAARGLLHEFSGHVRSSQLFALNLFAPLGEAGTRSVLRRFFPGVAHAEAPEFEYSDPADRLGEMSGPRRHRTQVDVVLRGRCSDGRRVALFVEVKLSELDFGHCTAFQNPANDTREVCYVSEPFGGAPSACFQLRNHGEESRRTYDRYIAVAPGGDRGCTYRLGVNQPMRNVALARSLVEAGELDELTYVLCAPKDNSAVWRRWAEAKSVLASSSVSLEDLSATEVLSHHQTGSEAALAERYGLDLASVHDGVRSRLRSAISQALSWLGRVAGEGSVLEQIDNSPGAIETAPIAEAAALSEALETAAEAARRAREVAYPVWSRIAEEDIHRQV